MNKTVIRVIFYALIIGVAFGAALLYFRSTALEPAPTTVADIAVLPETTGAPTNNSNTPIVAKNPVVKKQTPPPVATPPKPSKPSCIITVDGQKYDVQSLRSTHPGGDVFKCGADMSDIFHGQHGDNLRMIQRYLVR